MIERITNQNQIARHKLAEKINEIIDWINDVCALNVIDKQVTANLPNIDAGELAFLSKENSDLKDELDRTRKELEIAVDGIKYMRNNCLEYAADYMDKADEILEEITALEQKDK